MSQVKVYHKTKKGCIYKCKSCQQWHVLYNTIQFNLSHNELVSFNRQINIEVNCFCDDNDSYDMRSLCFNSEKQGGLILNFTKQEFLELEYLLGGALIIHNTENIIFNA